MSRFLVLGLSAFLLSTPTFADEPFTDWTGFHGGANVGGGTVARSISSRPGGTLITIPFEGSTAWGTNLHTSGTFGFAGAQFGYDYQIDEWVAGIEADFQTGSPSDGASNAYAATDKTGSASISNAFASSNPWFGTVRARAGTTWIDPGILVYVTGGLAFGREQINGLTTEKNIAAILTETFPFSNVKMATGFAVGGGAEMAVSGNVSIKFEYLHVELGRQSQTVATTTLGPAALPTDVMTFSGSVNNDNIIRVGMNFRF